MSFRFTDYFFFFFFVRELSLFANLRSCSSISINASIARHKSQHVKLEMPFVCIRSLYALFARLFFPQMYKLPSLSSASSCDFVQIKYVDTGNTVSTTSFRFVRRSPATEHYTMNTFFGNFRHSHILFDSNALHFSSIKRRRW